VSTHSGQRCRFFSGLLEWRLSKGVVPFEDEWAIDTLDAVCVGGCDRSTAVGNAGHPPKHMAHQTVGL
jgi:hypothetical protein